MHIQVSLTLDIDASATLSAMEQQIQAAGQQSMRDALRQAVRSWEKEHHVCPHCGSQCVRLEGTVARTMQALFGTVRLARQRMRCQQCFRRFLPSGILLQDLHQGRISPALVEATVLAGASWPYRHAARTLARLSGAQISAEEIQLLTNRSGREQAEQEEQIAQSKASQDPGGVSQEACPSSSASKESAASASQADRTIIGLDGGWVPSRDQRGGMEGKVAVIATQKEVLRAPVLPDKDATWYELAKYMRRHRHPSVTRSRWLKRRYVATFAPATIFGKQAAYALEQLDLPPQEQIVLADGADWIKQQARQHFPHATSILDWSHLWRTIAKAVRAVGVQQQHPSSWVKQQFASLGTWLWQGDVPKARALLLQWQEEPGGKSMQALGKAITYLSTQQEWIGS